MSDAIDALEDRDDIARTKFTRRDDEGRVTVEMWHDTQSLQRIAERAMAGVALSQKGIEKMAEREALAVRETRIDIHAEVGSLYPDIVEQLEDDDAD